MTDHYAHRDDSHYDIEAFKPVEPIPEFHAVYSVQLGELIMDGLVNFDDSFWDFDSYDKAQRDRHWDKFEARFYWREIGIEPFSQWAWEVKRKLNEIMPKYKPLFKALEEGSSILQTEGKFGKSRDIYSDFPQTLLGDNADYASTGTDKEYEDITLGNWLEQAESLKLYDDVDVMILKDLEPMFCTFFTVNVNGY